MLLDYVDVVTFCIWCLFYYSMGVKQHVKWVPLWKLRFVVVFCCKFVVFVVLLLSLVARLMWY